MVREKLEHGKKVLRNVLLALLLLSLVKFLAGVISNTSLLVADALHSFADLSAVLTAYIGLSIASRPANEKFPYGYYKAESVAALFVSLFILFAAFELALNGFENLFVKPNIAYPQVALPVALISGTVSLFLSRYQEKAAKFANSQAMHASAKEMLTDFFSSLLVFFALVFAYFKIPYAEGAGTVIIALIVGKIAAENLYHAILALMDIAPRDLERRVLRIIGSFSGIEGFANLKLRKAGPFAFGEVTIKVRKHLSVEEAHEISKTLEERIRRVIPEIEKITVRVEPYEESKQIIAVPVSEDKGLASPIAKRFARAKGFVIAFVDLAEKKIISWEYARNPNAGKRIRAGLATAKWLTQNYRINAVLTKEIGEIAYTTLKSSLVDVYLAKGKNAREALLAFAKGYAKKLEKPKVKK